tara:strand:- start:131 stop:508 length:378 start_codon:yes stop_codon:yes gene_type:complete
LLADIILILHFFIVIFITVGFLLIPIGYYYDWNWIRSFKLRLFHCGFMFLVTFETLLGITCPLTSIENNLRGISNDKSFISFWIEKIIYWDFPTTFFIFLYFIFLGWTLLMWKIYPPELKDIHIK